MDPAVTATRGRLMHPVSCCRQPFRTVPFSLQLVMQKNLSGHPPYPSPLLSTLSSNGLNGVPGQISHLAPF